MKYIFILSIFISISFSKGEVSKIFAHKERATPSSYQINENTYRWGKGYNIVIDGFEYNQHRYNYVSESPIIKIRRVDNTHATGEPCGLFASKKNSNNYKLEPSFPQGCDMAKVMGGRIINIGALDLFKNVNDSYDTPKNIERVDFISPNGITAPYETSNLSKAGHVVTEKSGNNEMKIAAILSLDANGDPSSFGRLVTVHDENGDAEANRKVNYGDTYIYLDNGTTIGAQKLGFYRDEKFSPQTSKPIHVGDSNEKLDMAFVSLEDLGIGAGEKYYGFSYFASDVYDNMNLVDYTSFPKNTPINSLGHTDTADPYGGVASYFVDEDIIPNPIGCLETAFMFQGDRTNIYALNIASGDMVSIIKGISDDNINSVGYNKKDGYFWGYNHTKRDGTIVKVGMDNSGNWIAEYFKIDGLNGFNSYVGDIDSSGKLYLKGAGNSKRVVVIDLDKNSSTYLQKIRDFNLNSNLYTADWAFNPKDNMLYAVNNGGNNKSKILYQIDPSNGTVIVKGDTNLIGYRFFGAGFFDVDGFYYIYDNNSGNIYRIDVANSSEAILFSTANRVYRNDGAMCTDVKFKFDFGDLPNKYPTKLKSNGARHSLPSKGNPTIYLGNGVSSESNGKPSDGANLDNLDDGVKINNISLQNKTINAEENSTLNIKTHGDGFLNAWIDWNGDGDFNDNGEQIAQNIDGSSGEINITINPPATDIDIVTYARFRYSYQQDLLPTGSAIDGEVEDYKITIKISDDLQFNIIRTNANIDDKLIYTQIAGRDFDYSIVSLREDINNMTLKVKLIDNINHKTLYESYKYIDKDSRANIVNSSDLKLLDVTKDAIFKVYFIKDSNGSIVHGKYNNKNSYNSILNQTGFSEISQEASEHFSIRPAGYRVYIKDRDNNNHTITYRDSSYSGGDSLKLSAGYSYIIEADAVALNSSKTKGYTTIPNEINTTLIFKDKSTCINKSNIPLNNYQFNNSHLLDNISHSNVGKYQLHIEDSSWSSEDEVKGSCIKGNSTISANGNIKSGCNISSTTLTNYRDINLKFYPYRFNITNINLVNRPNNGREYIYMGDLDSSLDMGVLLTANIVAEDKNGNRTTNFTSSCEASDTSLNLKYHITTDRIDNQPTYDNIYTIKGSEVRFKRAVAYNQESFHSIEDIDLDNNISIPADKFLDINEGNLSIHILLNLNKNLSEPTNPIRLDFNSLDIYDTDSSKVKNRDRVAYGTEDINISKLFYFASIFPDRENYDVYSRHAKSSISILMFCDKNISWCSSMIGDNGLNDIRTEYGWYIAHLHNSDRDGKVIKFILDNPLVEITPSADNLPNFNNGRIRNILLEYKKDIFPARVEVKMVLSPWLKYNREPSQNGIPFWRISFRHKGTMSGIGKTGYIIQISEDKVNNSHYQHNPHFRKKIDW